MTKEITEEWRKMAHERFQVSVGPEKTYRIAAILTDQYYVNDAAKLSNFYFILFYFSIYFILLQNLF